MSSCIVKKKRYLSRKAWVKAHGNPPPGMMVLHSCDNMFCVNLDHLHLGTHGQNMAEARERNRFKRGDQLRWARLDAERVRLIRQLLAEGQSQQLIADLFGVSQVAISKIKLGKSWRHVV